MKMSEWHSQLVYNCMFALPLCNETTQSCSRPQDTWAWSDRMAFNCWPSRGTDRTRLLNWIHSVAHGDMKVLLFYVQLQPIVPFSHLRPNFWNSLPLHVLAPSRNSYAEILD